MKTNSVSQLANFEGVYCSGFFIPNPSMVTAMSLVFQNIHILNNLEYVINFAKKVKIILPKEAEEKAKKFKIIPATDEIVSCFGLNKDVVNNDESDPLGELSEIQRENVFRYILLAQTFLIEYRELFPKVFKTDLLPDGEVLKVELIEKGINGAKNKYRVYNNPLIVTTDGTEQLSNLISQGVVPIVGVHASYNTKELKESLSARYIASLLAMKSVMMMLPSTIEANAETILEARERLSDQLPPFWSSMLKLSTELRKRLENCKTIDDAMKESQDVVDTIVRPALIELNEKMIKEKKNWFYKILSPVSKGLKVFAGKPPLSINELIYASLYAGAEIAIDITNQKVKCMSDDPGLTFLLQLGDCFVNK